MQRAEGVPVAIVSGVQYPESADGVLAALQDAGIPACGVRASRRVAGVQGEYQVLATSNALKSQVLSGIRQLLAAPHAPQWGCREFKMSSQPEDGQQGGGQAWQQRGRVPRAKPDDPVAGLISGFAGLLQEYGVAVNNPFRASRRAGAGQCFEYARSGVCSRGGGCRFQHN